MKGFQDNTGCGWLYRQALRLWRNLARNWKGDVEDADFFDLFTYDHSTPEREAIRRFRRHFDTGDLEDADALVRLHEAGEPEPEYRLPRGDFRTVRQSLYYLGGGVTNALRLDELEKESALKKGTSRPIGF